MNEVPVRKELLDILACPACDNRPKVQLTDKGIHCSQCGRTYPVENGVPIMLIERAFTENQSGDAQ